MKLIWKKVVYCICALLLPLAMMCGLEKRLDRWIYGLDEEFDKWIESKYEL